MKTQSRSLLLQSGAEEIQDVRLIDHLCTIPTTTMAVSPLSSSEQPTLQCEQTTEGIRATWRTQPLALSTIMTVMSAHTKEAVLLNSDPPRHPEPPLLASTLDLIASSESRQVLRSDRIFLIILMMKVTMRRLSKPLKILGSREV